MKTNQKYAEKFNRKSKKQNSISKSNNAKPKSTTEINNGSDDQIGSNEINENVASTQNAISRILKNLNVFSVMLLIITFSSVIMFLFSASTSGYLNSGSQITLQFDRQTTNTDVDNLSQILGTISEYELESGNEIRLITTQAVSAEKIDEINGLNGITQIDQIQQIGFNLTENHVLAVSGGGLTFLLASSAYIFVKFRKLATIEKLKLTLLSWSLPIAIFASVTAIGVLMSDLSDGALLSLNLASFNLYIAVILAGSYLSLSLVILAEPNWLIRQFFETKVYDVGKALRH